MYNLLENYIRLVFESEEHKSFEEFLDDVRRRNEENNTKNPSSEPRNKKNKNKIEKDPYYWLRPGYKKSNQTR